MTNNTFSKIAGLIALVFTLTVASSGHAQWYSSDANPSSIGPLHVRLRDAAKEACWTNLKESRKFAEEKLRSKGYDLTEDNDREVYKFEISVIAFRLNDGGCVYSIAIQLYKTAEVAGIFGYHEIGSSQFAGYTPENANNRVIEIIQAMVGKM
jgi:hypothetical protein